MDEGVSYVASMNNMPKVWTIHSSDSGWAQCSCPIAKECMICKHTVKVFKMFHPHVVDGIIVREAYTKYRVDRATPMPQSFTDLFQWSGHMRIAPEVGTTTNVEDVENDINHIVFGYTEQRTCGLAPTIPSYVPWQTLRILNNFTWRGLQPCNVFPNLLFSSCNCHTIKWHI